MKYLICLLFPLCLQHFHLYCPVAWATSSSSTASSTDAESVSRATSSSSTASSDDNESASSATSSSLDDRKDAGSSMGYTILTEGEAGIHAEMRILDKVFELRAQAKQVDYAGEAGVSPLPGSISIGISKLCCPNCYAAVQAVKVVWGKSFKITEESIPAEMHQATQGTQDARSTAAAAAAAASVAGVPDAVGAPAAAASVDVTIDTIGAPGIRVRGTHGVRSPWVEPRFLREDSALYNAAIRAEYESIMKSLPEDRSGARTQQPTPSPSREGSERMVGGESLSGGAIGRTIRDANLSELAAEMIEKLRSGDAADSAILEKTGTMKDLLEELSKQGARGQGSALSAGGIASSGSAAADVKRQGGVVRSRDGSGEDVDSERPEKLARHDSGSVRAGATSPLALDSEGDTAQRIAPSASATVSSGSGRGTPAAGDVGAEVGAPLALGSEIDAAREETTASALAQVSPSAGGGIAMDVDEVAGAVAPAAPPVHSASSAVPYVAGIDEAAQAAARLSELDHSSPQVVRVHSGSLLPSPSPLARQQTHDIGKQGERQ